MTTDLHDVPTRRLGELVLELTPLFKNPRTTTGLDKGSLRELASSIETDGIEDPIKVVLCRIPPLDPAKGDSTQITMVDVFGRTRVITPDSGDDILLVVDGQRRGKAAALAGWKADAEVPVVFATGEIVDLDHDAGASWEQYALRTSTTREQLSSYELAVAAERLRAAGLTNVQIGEGLGKSATWISRFLTAKTNATPALEKAWKAGDLTDEQVKDLASVEKDEQPAAVEQITALRSHTGRVAKASARAQTKAAAAAAPKKVKNGTSGAVAASAVPKVKHLTPPANKILLELVKLREDHKPRDPYAKGLADGVAYAAGAIEQDELGKGFKFWLLSASKSRLRALEVDAKKTPHAHKAMHGGERKTLKRKIKAASKKRKAGKSKKGGRK